MKILLIKHVNDVFEEIEEEFRRVVELRMEDGEVDWREEIKKIEKIQEELELYGEQRLVKQPQLIKECVKKREEYQRVIEEIEIKMQGVREGNLIPFRYYSNIEQTKSTISSLIFQAIKPKSKQVKSTTTLLTDRDEQQFKPVAKKQEKSKAKPTTQKEKEENKVKKVKQAQGGENKRCQFCSEKLSYLTAFKKHLICHSCGNKQRNYLKKPQ